MSDSSRNSTDRRSRARIRLAVAIALLVGALTLGLVAAAWIAGAFSGGYSTPDALARSYVNAYLDGDVDELCNAISPQERSRMEEQASSKGSRPTCQAIVTATLAGAGGQKDVDREDFAYTVHKTGEETADIAVTLAGKPYDTVAARYDATTKRWYLDLTVPRVQ